jgi:hypothetical protein
MFRRTFLKPKQETVEEPTHIGIKFLKLSVKSKENDVT